MKIANNGEYEQIALHFPMPEGFFLFDFAAEVSCMGALINLERFIERDDE